MLGEYNPTYDYYKTISSLRLSCKYYPLELQLIWVLEILLLSAYMANRDKCRRNSKGNHIFYFGNLRTVSRSVPSIDLDALNLLIKFRNLYVHEGAKSAQSTFNVLVYDKREELENIAKAANITLNRQVLLYDTFGVMEFL